MARVARWSTDVGSVSGLDAMGVGRLDLGTGLEYLQRLATRASFPFLSANLVGEDGEALFAPSILLERGGLTIGVTSVLPADLSGRGYQSIDPYRAARTQGRELRESGAELVIVLSNLGMKKDKKLANRSRADLILSSHSRELTPEGLTLGPSLAGEPGSRGRYLGEARWYQEGAGRRLPLVVTTVPVRTEAPQHPRVRSLVESMLARLADPVLGVPPIPIEDFDDPEFRNRERR